MIYSSGYTRLNGNHPIKLFYYFFRHAVLRNKKLEVDQLDALDRIDIAQLEKDYDIVLLPTVTIATYLGLRGIENCNIPVIAKASDPQDIFRRNMVEIADRLKIDYFFDFYDPACFYRYYPKRFKYEVVCHGLEPSLYTNEVPWTKRTPDMIALSGKLGDPGVMRKIYWRWYRRTPKELLLDYHYKLRTKCNDLPYVVHTQDIYPAQSTDQLPRILSGFRSAIVATTNYITAKYMETPAAGCLTFMEITDRNYGASLGYEDGKSAIFINKSNYKEKFQEYIDSPDDSRWEKIAQAGKRHALENLSNDRGVEKLIHIMRKALGEEDAKI